MRVNGSCRRRTRGIQSSVQSKVYIVFVVRAHNLVVNSEYIRNSIIFVINLL